MAMVLEECTNEEQNSVVCVFCGQKNSMQRAFTKKYFLFTVGGFVTYSGSQLDGKRLSDDEEVETVVRKWLRQQSKDFFAVSFDAMIK
jgi:hypothetical protein